ncbi:MAG: type I restriction enzyme S subunit [Colwellia sp.]|jgi:type I restriction enzyme S subunit
MEIKTESLESLCELVVDCPHSTPKWTDEGIIVLRNQNIKNGVLNLSTPSYTNEGDYQKRIKRAVPQAGDIVITREAPMGEVCIIPEGLKCCLGQRQVLLRPRKDISGEYLFWALQSPYVQHQISWNEGTGTTVSNVRIPVLKALQIPRHTYGEDKAASILSCLANKLELTKATNQTLEKIAQVLFKSWFIDFDPIIDNALAAGANVSDFPDAMQHRAEQRKQAQQVIDYKPLPENLRNIFPAEFEQCEELSIGIAGWIPKGWKESNTDEEFGIKGGSTPSTKNSDFWEGGQIHWTSPKDLSGNNTKIILDTSRKVTEAGLAKITSGLLPVDTVLMSSRAPVGYLALTKVPLAINQGYIALLCEKTLTPEYTIQFLDSIMDEIKGISGGTTFAEISKKTFRSIKLVVPTKSVVDAYTSVVRTHYEKITENIKQTNTLTETRDYLLPKLISGELTIPDSIKTENIVNHQQPKESLSNHA